MDRLRAAISARVIGSLPLRVHDRLRPANAVVLAVAMLLTATVAGPTSAAAEPDPVSIGVPTTDGRDASLGTARVPVTLDAGLADGIYSVQVRVAPGTGTLRIPTDSSVTEAGSLPTGTSTPASSIAFAGELAALRAALEDLHFTPADPAAPAPTELRVDVAATIPTIAGRDLYYNPANGHVYEHVRLGSAISWQDARTAAAGRTFERSGLPDLVGHLATITTADEAAFVADVIAEPNTWIGASDDAFVVGEARGAPVFRITHVERPVQFCLFFSCTSWYATLTTERGHPYSMGRTAATFSSVIYDGLNAQFSIPDITSPVVLTDVPSSNSLTIFAAGTASSRTAVTDTSPYPDARLTGRVGTSGQLGILRTEGDWYWVDGPEAGQRVADGHTAWASGQPTSSSGTAIAVTSDGWKNLAKNDASITGYLVEYSGSIDLPTFSGSRWIVPHAPSRLRTSAPTDGFDVRLAWNAAAGSGADPAIRYEYSFDDATWLPAGGADARAVQFDLPSGVTDACNGNVLVRAAIGPFASSGVLTSSGPLCPTPSIVVAAPTEIETNVFAVPITPSDFDPSQRYAAFVDVPNGDDATLSLTVDAGLSPAFDFDPTTFRRIGGDGNELGFVGTYAEVTAALASVRLTRLRTPGAGIRVSATLTAAPPEDEGGSSFYYFPENGHYYEYVTNFETSVELLDLQRVGGTVTMTLINDAHLSVGSPFRLSGFDGALSEFNGQFTVSTVVDAGGSRRGRTVTFTKAGSDIAKTEFTVDRPTLSNVPADVLEVSRTGSTVTVELSRDPGVSANAPIRLVGFAGALSELNGVFTAKTVSGTIVTFETPTSGTISSTTFTSPRPELSPRRPITWTDARDQAAASTLFGMEGYLVTITSLAESRFVFSQIDAPDIWMGASDDFALVNAARGDSFYSGQRTGATPSEGRWYWVTGPEAGQQFWELSDPENFRSQERDRTETVGGATTPASSGRAVGDRFHAWCPNEPNNRETFDDELDRVEHYGSANFSCGGTGAVTDLTQNWNDFIIDSPSVRSYLIEYGGMPGDVSTVSSAQNSRVFGARPVVFDADVVIVDGGTSSPRGIDWDVIDGKLVTYATGDGEVRISAADLQAALDDASNRLTSIKANTLTGGPNITIAGPLAFDLADDSVYSGDISGTGSLIKRGPGDLLLGGNNTYSGGTTVEEGTLSAPPQDPDGPTVSPFGDGPIIVDDGASIDDGGRDLPGILTIESDPTVTIFDPTNPANDGLTPGIRGEDWDVVDGKLVVYTDPVAIPSDALQDLIDDGTLHTIEAGTLDGDGPLEIPGGTDLTFDVSGDSTYSGDLSGGGGIIKKGDGDLTLGGANTYSGGTTIAEGELTAGFDYSTDPFGPGPFRQPQSDPDVTIYDPDNPANDSLTPGIKGEDWDVIDGKLVVYTDPVAIPSDALQPLINDGTLHTIEAGTLDGDGPLNIPDGRTLTLDIEQNSTFDGDLSGEGGIIKKGVGDLTLGGDITLDGGVVITDPAITIFDPSNSPANDGLTPGIRGVDWDVIDGKLVVYTDPVAIPSDALQPLIDGGDLTTIEAGTLDGDGPLNIPDGGTLTLDVDGDSTYSGDLSGGGGLIKKGDGDLTLGGNNTYSGGTTVAEGELTAGGNTTGSDPVTSGPFGTGPVKTLPGATLDTTGKTVENTVLFGKTDPAITIYDPTNEDNDGLTEGVRGQDWDVIDGILVVYTDPVAIPSDVLQDLIDNGTLHTIEAGTLDGDGPLEIPEGRTLTLDVDGDSTYSGDLSGDGGIIKKGDGDLTLNGDNTLSGGVVHPDADIVVVPDATDPAAVLGVDYDIIDGRLIAYTDPLNIRREDLQAALDDPTNPLTIIEGGTFSGNQPLVIPEGTNLVIDISDASGDSTYTGNLSGPGGIIKKGEGDLELRGINTYEGGTTVLGGGIDANLFPVSPFGFGPVNVLPGAELDTGGFETFALLSPPRGPITDADIEVVDSGGRARGDGWDVIDGKLVIFETDADGTIRIDGSALQAALDDPTNPLTTIEANTFSGDQPLNIPNGTTLLLDLEGDSVYSGDLSGGGGIEKSGEGDLLLEGNNSYSGGTLLSEGSLTAGSDSVSVPGQPQTGPFGTGPVNVLPGAELVIPEEFTVSNDVTQAVDRPDITVISPGRARGDGWDVIGGKLVVYDSPIDIDRGALQNALDDPVAPLTVIEANTFSGDEPLVLPDGRTLTLDLTGDAEYSGEISGGGGLTKAGPGTLLLSGDNTYSGGTTIEEGTLEAGSSSSEDGTTGPFGTGTITVGPDGTLDTAGRTVSNEVVTPDDGVAGSGTGGGTVGTTPSGPSIALGCTDDRRIGEVVTCTVTGGPADHEMLWEAAYNPVFASGPVLLGADGSGSFSFTVPAEALGEPITVTLVGWGVSALLGMGGTVGDADATLIPSRIDAGGGPMPPAPMPSAIMTVLLGTMVAVLQRDRRLVRAGASSEEPLGPDPDPAPEPDLGLDRLAVLAEELRIAYEAVERGD